MKMLVLIYFIFNLIPAIAKDCPIFDDPISKEILSLDCSVKNVANAILNGDEVVPSRIYHYGREDVLSKNIPDRTIPQEDWDQYIMGEENLHGLKPERRGLYGRAALSLWFMRESFIEISIKQECRNPKNVISLNRLNENKDFINWFEKKKKIKKYDLSLKEISSKCYVKSQTDYQGFGPESCRVIINEFLEDKKVKIIQDSLVEKSFYIRDRDCIENIRGADQYHETLDILASTPAFWIENCDEERLRLMEYTGPSVYKNNSFLMKHVFKGLYHVADKVGLSVIEKLKENGSYAHQSIPHAIDALLRCKKKGDEKTIKKRFTSDGDYSENPFEFYSDVDYTKICR